MLKMGSRESLWPLIGAFISIFVLQNGSCVQLTKTSADKCGGQLWCMDTSEQSDSGTYYYIHSSGNCEAVPASCVQPYDNCSFTSLAECQKLCMHVGGCESTPFGCCPEEGVARAADGSCPGEEESTGDRSSGGVRWDLLATGICGTALLLGAVVVIGIVSYVYKQKTRQRHRRRYIQEVLSMYDSTDSTDSSECSYIDDNPENNNLFDKL